MHIASGIDIGSGFTKAVIVSQDGLDRPIEILARASSKTGVNLAGAARAALEAAAADCGIARSDIEYLATTGLGRHSVPERDIQITEITSGARGAYFLYPDSSCVLDIGAQSTRAISTRGEGRVKSFKTNDKCAAGSGSFIVRAAKYLQLDIEDVGNLALEATNPQMISSICAVLAESEIINLVSAGSSVEDILRGIYDSLSDRAATLLRRVGMGDSVTFIGGVARQAGMVFALEQRLGVKVHVDPHADSVCALGAAILGLRRLQALTARPLVTEATLVGDQAGA